MVQRRNILFGFIAVFLTAVACAALLIGAEFYMRANVFDPALFYIRTPGWSITFRPTDDGTPGVYGDAIIKTNGLGLRGEQPSWFSSPRILAIGGSTTEDIMMSDSEMWTSQLEQNLRKCSPRTWVGNGGKAGTTAPQHVLQIDAMLPRLRIDRVLVLLGLNDMIMDEHIHLGDYKLPDNWDVLQAFQFRPDVNATWVERLALYQLAKRFMPGTVPPEHQLVEFGKVIAEYRARRQQVQDADWITVVPDMTEHLKHFRSNLERMVSITKAAGVEITFMTQPALWKPDMNDVERSRLYAGGLATPDKWPKNPNIKWYASETMRKMLEQYNEVTRAVCRERNVQCIDLARELPKSAGNYYDDFHYSEAGSAQVGRIAARHMGCN